MLAVPVFGAEVTVPTPLAPVVVTATRSEQPLADAPADTVVVGREQIELRNLVQPDQALNTSSGVFVQRPRGTVVDTTFNEIVIRGIAEQKRSLYMFDGIPLNNIFLGRFFGGSANDLQQVELVKGAFSALYGGNAMGGVMNNIIVTPQERSVRLSYGNGQALGAENGIAGRNQVYASYGDRFNDTVSVFLSYEYDQAKNYPTNLVVRTGAPTAGVFGAQPTLTPVGRPAFLVGDRGDSAAKNYNATFKTVVDFSADHRLSILAMQSSAELMARQPNTLLTNGTGQPLFSYGASAAAGVRPANYLTSPERLLQNVYALTYEGVYGSVKTKVTASMVDRPDDNGFSFPAGTNQYGVPGPAGLFNTPSRTNRLDAQMVIPIAAQHLLTVGATGTMSNATQRNTTTLDWSNLNLSNGIVTGLFQGKERTGALFAQDEILLTRQLTAYVGLRQDWWETYDGFTYSAAGPAIPATAFPSRQESATTPRGAVVYKYDPTLTLRGSIGGAFRPPNVFELYTQNLLQGGVIVGSPYLSPERSVTFDMGAEWAFAPGYVAKATYFHNYIKDYIYRRQAGLNAAGLPTTVFANAASAESQGVELGVRGQLASQWTGFANYTFTQSEFLKNYLEPATVGMRLPLVPKSMANLGVTYSEGPWTANWITRYVSKRFFNPDNSDTVIGVSGARDPFSVTEIFVRYRFDKHFDVSFAIDNLFNKYYFDSVVAPGRSAFLRLNAQM